MRQSTILEIRIGSCGHAFNDARSYITVDDSPLCGFGEELGIW